MPETMTETNIGISSRDHTDDAEPSSEGAVQDEPSVAESKSSTTTKTLPNNVWSNILEQYVLGESNIPDIFLLRTVSRWFNDEVLGILFTRQLIDFSWMWRYGNVPLNFRIYFIQGFFAKRKLPLRSHKQMRRAMLRAVGLDPRISDAADDTCLTLKPGQPCLSQVIGPSSGATCRMHDLMKATALGLASSVFYMGGPQSTSLIGFSITEARYWKLLTIAYQVSKNVTDARAISELRSLLQDLSADVTLSDDDRSNMICDCFVLAARSNNTELIDILYREADEEIDLATKLGKRFQGQNSLWESAKLGHVEAHQKFLSKKWEFDPDVHTYNSCLSNIIYQKNLPASTRAKLLRSVFDWSNDWRNANIMEALLIVIGNSREPVLMEAVVSAVKAQHFFTNFSEEENNPYHAQPAQPLWSLSHHENSVEMVKLFLDNRSLILPRLKDETWKEMRSLTIQHLLRDRSGKDGRCQASAEALKLIIDHSHDLVQAKHGLQNSIIMNCGETDLDKWDWLAEKIGLETKCDSTHEGHTLGSALMEIAVEKLDVGIVRFLVKNGIGLIKEATTIRVKEEDEAAMKKLQTITELLAEGGQGEFTQKRTVYTTFSASKVVPPKPKRKSVLAESNPIVRVSSTVVKTAHAARPRSLKRRSISKRHGSKSGTKSSSSITTQSGSSGSSVFSDSLV